VVVRRPYVFLYREERDPCERALINLATARTEFTNHAHSLNVPNTFRYSRGSILTDNQTRRMDTMKRRTNLFNRGNRVLT
jgi:hypothetical protein